MNLKNYPGNKGFDKAKIEILNLIPETKIYIEPFAGSAAIARNVFTSGLTVIVNDINKNVVLQLIKELPESTTIFNHNALWFLRFLMKMYLKHTRAVDMDIFNKVDPTDVFIYLDPPYPKASRRSPKDIYDFEMTDQEHEELLSTLLQLPFNCMISTYPNELYAEKLSSWNKHEFSTSVHGKIATEVLYYNYTKPEKLLNYSYVGADCWERQRINRKVNRHISKLSSLPPGERYKIIHEINKAFL